MDKGSDKQKPNVIEFKGKNKGGNDMAIAEVKMIKATPIIEGKYAEEIIKEVTKKPSARAIERNKKASELVKRLRG